MPVVDATLITAVAALLTALATVIWAIRRDPGDPG